MKCSKDLAQKEGIFVGITAGATFAGALQVGKDAPKGANILCMLPDTGERYLSTPLFADIPADMTEEELEIMRSTPSKSAAAQNLKPRPENEDAHALAPSWVRRRRRSWFRPPPRRRTIRPSRSG